MSLTYTQVWDNCLDIIRDNVNLQSFKTWFAPIKPVSLEGKVLTIQVPSLFFYEWLEEHYVTLLKKIIKKELGPGAKLEYNIIVENSSGGAKPHTINIPTQRSKSEDEDSSLPENMAGIRNPFVIPGIKKMHVDAQLNPSLNFSTYIEGECNRLARSAGQAVSSRPGGTSFNPLFIYGGVGLGKTHLAQAIGNQVRESFKTKAVLYVTSEKFTNQFIEAIKANSLNDFINFYQMIDVLIVDDVQFFANKDRTQDIFFHIFNHLHQNGKQLILTSDRPPKDLQGLEERLLSRFKWGLSADLQIPDYETRLAILEQKMYADGVELPREVIEYVAYNITGNVRELEGTLISLLAHSSLTRREIDISLAKDILKNFIKQNNKELTIEHIQKLVCDHFDMAVDLLKSKTRKRHIVQARQISMYFAKHMTKTSLANIGKHFGGRDHSTVIHACQTVCDLMETDNRFKSKVHELEKLITTNFK
ncbi:MAG: chromosomal replication initiator protein DnaA [Sphingobacteriales bacterium]|nr:MAG: chromosomal replication initiator protein DnaA [Sphingobacteriales bacterium]